MKRSSLLLIIVAHRAYLSLPLITFIIRYVNKIQMSEKHEFDSNVFDIKSHQLNEKDHGIAEEELYPEANDSMTCWQKVKNAWNNFVNRTIDYFEYDRVFNAEGQPQIDLKKCYKRFLENYDETYSEREMRFAFSFDYVLQEKIKEEQKKEKNFMTELYRFICCEGGNEMEEIDEAYKSEREYQQIIKKKLLEKKEVFEEMMRKEAEEEKEKEKEKQREIERERQKENEKLKEIINNDSLQLYDEEQEKKEISRKKRNPEAIAINTKILKVSQTEQHIFSSENVDNVSDRTHKKGESKNNPSSNTYDPEDFDQEIHNTKSNKYAKSFNSNGQSSKKVTTTYTTEENLLTRNTYEENHVFNNYTNEEKQGQSLKKKKNQIQADFQEDEIDESQNRVHKRKKRVDGDANPKNNNSKIAKKLANKDPADIDQIEEQDGTHSRKFDKNTDKVTSANPNKEEHNSNAYGNQGTYNKDTNFNSFNASNNPNNNSAVNNLKPNLVETDDRKNRSPRQEENDPTSSKNKKSHQSNNRVDEQFYDFGVPVDSKKKGQNVFSNNFDAPNNVDIDSVGAKGTKNLGKSNNSDEPISITYNRSDDFIGKQRQNSKNNDPNLYLSEANNSVTATAMKKEREVMKDQQHFAAQPFDFDELEDSNGQNFKKNKQSSNSIAKSSHIESSPYKYNQHESSDPKKHGTSKTRNNRSPGKVQNIEQSQQYRTSPPKNNKNELTQDLNQQFDEPASGKQHRSNFKNSPDEENEQSSSAVKKRRNKRSNHPQEEGLQDSYEQEEQRGNNRPNQGGQESNYEGIRSKKEKKIKQTKPNIEEQQHQIIFEDDTNDFSKQPSSSLQDSEEVSPQQAHKKRKVKKMVVNDDNMEEEINLQDFSLDTKNVKEYSKTEGVKQSQTIVQASKKRRNKKQLRNNDDQMNVQEVVFDALQGTDVSQVKQQPDNQGSLVKAEKKRKRVKPRREDQQQQQEIIQINF